MHDIEKIECYRINPKVGNAKSEISGMNKPKKAIQLTKTCFYQ